MDARSLAALEHENLITAFSLAASQVPGAVVERRDGVASLLTGMPLHLFNQIIVDDIDGTADDRTADDGAAVDALAAAVDALAAAVDALAAAVELARGRGDPFIVSLRRGVDDRFHPMIRDLGLEPAGVGPWMPGMALHPIAPDPGPASVDGLDIQAVTDSAGVRDHVVAAAGGFEMPEAWLESVVTDRLLSQPDSTLYVGYVDGAPVTTGLGVRTGRTIGVYNIATVPEARRRGYGAAMTTRIVDEGVSAGCDVAILQATEMGRPIYERLGFRLVVEYDGFVDPE